MVSNILIVDDEDLVLEVQYKTLSEIGFKCFKAKNLTTAKSVLEKGGIDLVLLDIKFPGESGLEFLNHLQESYPAVAVVMATAIDDVDTAMECLRLGADDYLVKPLNIGKTLISVNNALEKKSLQIADRKHKENLKFKLCEQEEKLKASQAMIVQQEKLAAIGQLAAGVAHEINNPLGFIGSNLYSLNKYRSQICKYQSELQELLDGLPEEKASQIKTLGKKHKISVILEDLPELISDSLEGTERIKTIVHGLKCFSRSDSETETVFDINECIESAITISWNEIKYNSKLIQDLGDLEPVFGYPQQLAQVFMNLLVNASHAIDKNGEIKISSYQEGNTIIVEVQDNGCGISDAHKSKIFDPFFTTKEAGKGTGLGMSIANDIIHRHSGEISVESKLDVGTTFKVSIPCSKKN